MIEDEGFDDLISYFELKFHKKEKTFYVGEKISGVVEIQTKGDVQKGEVSLIFRGESLVCWNEDEEKGNDQVTTIRCHRNHWLEKVFLFGTGRKFLQYKKTTRFSCFVYYLVCG